MKLTTLLFGLLLAVGWTSNVFAQSATYKAEDIKDWTYTYEDASGNPQTGKYVDEVTDPYQMYGLLRWIYMDKRFPGPYQSAYDQNGNRERTVYYGGMDGGWEIPGTAIPTPPISTQTINDEVTVANGSSTAAGYNFVPVYGYYFETAQKSQIIYTAAELNLKAGDKITSLSFYPRTLNFSGGNIKVSLGTTTASSFTSATAISATMTQVAQVSSYTVSNGRWTINFSQPFTYNGDNLIVQCESSGGNYGSSQTYFYGTEPSQSVYRSYNNYTPARYTFLPKATFGYTRTVKTGGVQAIGDITIAGTNRNAAIKSIEVKSGNTTLFYWSYADHGTASGKNSWVAGMHLNSWASNSTYGWLCFNEQFTPIVLDGWLFDGYSTVQVLITGYNRGGSSGDPASLIVNGTEQTIPNTVTSNDNPQTYTWTINATSFEPPVMYEADTYKPNEEGYTALVVKLKNKIVKDSINEIYNSKEQIIEYLRTNVKSIQLLTDGLRIGEGEDVGTVFNCPSTDVYNRFFFLGKGQARQKTDYILLEQIYNEQYLGEDVPFRQMFEQFSPTGGKEGDDIKDFYSKMMKGEVFPVIHDCLSVIQNQHEFSMSGHDGETSYDMPGMNFFIPDRRLQYWELVDTIWRKDVPTVYTIDGRTMNPYQYEATRDLSTDRSRVYRTPLMGAVWYAQYDTARHAPVTGIYLLNLQAEASQANGYDAENYPYYNVDLNWRSSLNEMAGSAVEQTYIIYQIVTDSVTGVRTRVPIDTVKNCTDFRPHLQLDTLYQQRAHSYTLYYIIEGSPVDSDHPGFVAWSNEVKVIIPGLDDFMLLKLHHYESDFEIRRVGDEDYNSQSGTYDEKNYYRNYLQPENDIVKGITAEDILNGYDSFMLYRSYTVDGVQVKEAVAKLKFAVDQQGKVLYKITYIDEHENYHAPNFDNTELVNVINQLLNNQ